MVAHSILIVSHGGKSYEELLDCLNQEKLGLDVLRVDTLGEALSVIKKSEASILLADVSQDIFDIPGQITSEEFQARKGNAKEDIKFIKQYIHDHCNEELSLKQLARIVCLSPNYFCSLFKKVEGISITGFIMQIRMEKAAFLILTEEKMMQDIAAEVGFCHSSYFCRSFHSYYGETPKQYKISHQKKKES